MASIQQRGKTFRIVFRYGSRKFSRTLRTKDRKAADACLARLENNLRRLELGLLEVPDGADLPTFLLSDGRAQRRPEATGREAGPPSGRSTVPARRHPENHHRRGCAGPGARYLRLAGQRALLLYGESGGEPG